jgi:hypothetical protein
MVSPSAVAGRVAVGETAAGVLVAVTGATVGKAGVGVAAGGIKLGRAASGVALAAGVGGFLGWVHPATAAASSIQGMIHFMNFIIPSFLYNQGYPIGIWGAEI